MTTNRNAEFVKVARVKFAELRAEYSTLFPTTTPSQFVDLVRAYAPTDPTPFDYLSAASVLVAEAHEDSAHFERMCEDFEAQRLYEAAHFAEERDWT